MDKGKLSNSEKLKVCRAYYRLGFLCLPFIWAINYFWFTEEANKNPSFEEQSKIRIYRKRSGIGALTWLVLILVWIITFQINRIRWGEFGDHISFIIPTGSN